MKNIILIIVIFISLSINAQDKGFSIGIEAGPSIVSMYSSNSVDLDNRIKISFIGAITTKFKFNKFFSLKSGIGFERKGITNYIVFTDEFGSTIMEGTQTYNFDYITIPLLAQLELGDKVKFLLNTGPFLGVLIDLSGSSSFENLNYIYNKYYYKTFDFGISSNIGILFEIGNKLSIIVEGRNNVGLHNIVYNGSLKTNSFAIITGISYSFNKE